MKKILKFAAIFVAVIVLAVTIFVAYIHHKFNNFTFNDSYPVHTEYLPYFPDSYQSGRTAFREAAAELAQKFPIAERSQVQVPCPADSDLTIDLCYLPALSDTGKILIISSGVHGVEGYVGSAMQQFIMKNYITEEFLSQTAVLFIHSVNPYGFKYSRRVTENNVDLNRNSSADQGLYTTINEGYPKVYELINPKGELDMSDYDKRFFFVDAVNAIRKSSMPVLRQAVLQGQYQYPTGLYFGGNQQEPQIDSLIPVLKAITSPYSTVFAIDLHTGYGERGRLHLFPNPVDSLTRSRMETIFEGYHIDWGDGKDFYTVTGDFVNFVGSLNPDKTFIPMTLEYGTLNSQTTLGSLKSIQIMISENQGIQYGYQSPDDSVEIKPIFLDMYYPNSDAWRSNAMDVTKELLDKVFPRYLKESF